MVLLNYPILSLLNINILVLGYPLLFIYIFGTWGLLIFLSALATSRLKSDFENSDQSGK